MSLKHPLSLSISAAILGLTITALPSFAQETAPKNSQELEEVVVTGSRIARTNLTASTPINLIDADAIVNSGAINISEVLQTQPATGVATFSSTVGNFDVNNSGVNTVDLRNLGEDRTLVLVNGRRFVAGVPGSQNVDLNSIPTQFIERVEVITGGASAVYGSDALAGVVNFILKKDYEGFEISGQSGRSEQGDDETHRLSMFGGFTFGDNRGSAMMSLTFDKENGVFARNRDNLGVDGFNKVFDTENPKDYDKVITPAFSSFSEKGRFIIPDGQNLVVDTDGTVREFNSNADGFNRQAFRALSTPTERTLFSGVMSYDINDNLTWFTEATYARTETQSNLEPFPLSSDDIYGDNAADCFDTNEDGSNDDCAYGIAATNPFVPTAMLQAAREANPGVADEDLVIGFARRTTELDPRGADNLRQSFRLVTGFEGQFLEDFKYEAYYNYGRTAQDQKSSGQINVLNMRNALDAVVNPDTGEIVCRDEVARLQGCIPVNVFGKGSMTAELTPDERSKLLRYLQANSSRTATLEQNVVSAYVTGPMFTLPGGVAQFSIGAEYRDESSEAIADGLSQQGLNAGNISPPTVGRFNVTEVYGEVNLPLLADKPFIESLEMELAASFSDYSTIGSTSAYAVSGRYSPIGDVLIRTQWSRAVRAPNISELFQGLSETFEGGDDPCEGLTLDSNGNPAFLNVKRDTSDPNAALTSGVNESTVNSAIAQACIADPSVAARVNETGGMVLTQAEIQGVAGFNGGAAAANSDLFEETADTVTIGAVWNPSFSDWINPLSLSVDYYNIEI
ncbi:MAG: TonB-dependent receptor, partial [Exilibacterium sp.]